MIVGPKLKCSQCRNVVLMIVVQSASNLWEEQRAWLLGLDTQLVKYMMMDGGDFDHV